MNAYRHLNLLISDEVHRELREVSFKENVPVAHLVRKGIAVVLKERKEHSGEHTERARLKTE